MASIHTIQLEQNGTNYLIEPKLFAVAGGTASALTATINNFELFSGAYVHIKVGTINANATLNVSSTGAKDIYYNGEKIKANMLISDNIYTFLYTGTYWEVIGDIVGKNIMIKTTAQWSTQSAYIAPAGAICIYTDANTYTDGDDNVIVVPGIKISNGTNALMDLPFISDDIRAVLDEHINNTIIHITSAERTFWNNKLNCDITNENLVLNRS